MAEVTNIRNADEAARLEILKTIKALAAKPNSPATIQVLADAYNKVSTVPALDGDYDIADSVA